MSNQRPSFAKREREMKLKDKAKAKAERRAARAAKPRDGSGPPIADPVDDTLTSMPMPAPVTPAPAPPVMSVVSAVDKKL